MIEITTERPDLAKEFYHSFGHPGPDPEDLVFLAMDDEKPVGVVRLCPGDGYSVLRTMRVADDYQRRGLGTRMLGVFEKALVGKCYILAFAHLDYFYGQIGFKTIPVAEAPTLLQERFSDYRQRGFNAIMMLREG
jgi:N-acetylglutamate synthase-like GNAT family acetyltransferase